MEGNKSSLGRRRKSMVTRSSTTHPGVGPAAIRLRPAAGIGILLLVIGLSAGVFFGSELRQADEPSVAAEASEVARQAGTANTLRSIDDFGVRHPGEVASSATSTLRPRDDFGVRHPGEVASSATSTLRPRDDFGVRHP
jgi:hypothetical protein